jgi:hypothetical protein
MEFAVLIRKKLCFRKNSRQIYEKFILPNNFSAGTGTQRLHKAIIELNQ